jgi:phosphodiesterase/alkaline phosphatase D-like protein
VPVDADLAGGGSASARASGRSRDLWAITIGDTQYAWLRRTLETSRARYKFVFAHHVMGTGRGGVEQADFYEWAAASHGSFRFREKRPAWALPIHQLMVQAGVTIFFQGHDHLFARQEKDGVIYQTAPSPADATYTAFNADAYRSGVVLPNAGHLRVMVSADGVRVDYVRSRLAKDETPAHRNGEVAYSYTVRPRRLP